MNNENTDVRKRFRSPPYPSLTLPKAIERAEQLFRKANHYAAGISVLADAWQLSVESGGLLKSAAALIQYSLLSDQGTGKSRKFQLTDVARRVIQDTDPESDKRKQAIRTSALMPSIHKELWERFGSPDKISDSVLRNHLLFDRVDNGEAPYSEASASEVIQTYRDALLFAGITAPDISDTVEYEETVTSEVPFASETANSISQGQKPFGEPSHSSHRNLTGANIGVVVADETEWMRSKLGSDTVVRIVSNRDLGPREIGKLIRLLQAQQSVLEEDDALPD